jgi:hypothetical protein
MENAILNPSHSNFPKVEIPAFLFLFSKVWVFRVWVASGITMISNDTVRYTVAMENFPDIPNPRCYSTVYPPGS